MEKDGSFSSFFMLLLAATSLIVILSEFFAGNFNFRSLASTSGPQEEYVEESVNSQDTFLENSEEGMYVDPEDAADDNIDSGDNLNFEINASITPSVEVQGETRVF